MAANFGTGTNTPKYLVFRENFDRLVTVVTQAVSDFATKAFSKKLIGKELLNSATATTPASTSATNILRAILDKIECHDWNFDTFIDILKQIPTLKDLADDLLADFRAKINPPPSSIGSRLLFDTPPPRSKRPVVTDEDFDSGVSGMNTEQSNAASPNGNSLPERQSFAIPHDGHSSPTTALGIQETHHTPHNGMPKLEPAVDFKPSDHQSDRTHPVPVQAGAYVTASNTLEPSQDIDIPSEAEKPLVENDEPVGGLTMSTQASSSESIQSAVLIVPEKKCLLPRGNQDQPSSEDRVDNIVEQVQMIRNDLRQTKAENEQYIAENADLQEKVQEMEEKIDILEEELQETKAVVDAKNTEIASLRSEIQQYQVTIADYQSKIASTEKKNEDERKRYAAQIKKLQDKLKVNDKKVLELTEEKYQLQLKVQSMCTDEERLKRLLAEAKEELSNLKLKLKEDELEIHKSESQAQIALQSEEIQQLKQKLSQMSMNSLASSDSSFSTAPE